MNSQKNSAFHKTKPDLPDSVYLTVEKPARYVGGEWNEIKKNIVGDADGASPLVRFAFCFPDTYEVGMSHLGMRILYDVVNRRDDACCERVFAPWTDMEERMRAMGAPLRSLENRIPLGDFDILGFTLQYELCYTNVLNMLDLAGVSVLSRERDEYAPIVCAGGPCVCNPAPTEDFIDMFLPGEGEEVINDVIDLYKEMRAESVDGRVPRSKYLARAAAIDGVYVPAYPPAPGKRVKKRIISDLGLAPFPEKTIVPFAEIVHDRVMLELFRGCSRGCRFCQAGFIYRPVREKPPDVLLRQAQALLESTGYEELALTSLSTSDYECLPELAAKLLEITKPKKVNLSLPSLRADNFSSDLAGSASAVRKSGLTFAPEAGTQRLRDVVNKGVREDDMLNSIATAVAAGFSGVKLYFMIGLPTETDEDIAGIAEMAKKASAALYSAAKSKGGRPGQVHASVSTFVPKPFTPFQWEPQDNVGVVKEKQRRLASMMKARGVVYKWHDAEAGALEAAFARGGREMGAVLLEAWRLGCVFDGWGGKLNTDLWAKAFESAGVDRASVTSRLRTFDEKSPWDIMDYGVDKNFLWAERERAYAGATTPNCRESCAGCGIWNVIPCNLRARKNITCQASLFN